MADEAPLLASLAAIAAARDEPAALELARAEAERLLGARAELLPAGARPDRGLAVPLLAGEVEIAVLRLDRDSAFTEAETTQLRILAAFAARAAENARLLEEAGVRETEHARLSDQLVTAEQEERRRLALHLHDTSVQALSGIALMLDAGLHLIEQGRLDEARTVVTQALERQRATIASLRDLSFELEPVVLRDQGFAPAVSALAEQLGLGARIRVDLDVAAAEEATEKAQAALYQIIREALHGAIRRGPPTRMSIRVERRSDGGLETVIADDAPGERRRATFEPIEERARTLSGRVEVVQGADGGTTVRVSLPPYAV